MHLYLLPSCCCCCRGCGSCRRDASLEVAQIHLSKKREQKETPKRHAGPREYSKVLAGTALGTCPSRPDPLALSQKRPKKQPNEQRKTNNIRVIPVIYGPQNIKKPKKNTESLMNHNHNFHTSLSLSQIFICFLSPSLQLVLSIWTCLSTCLMMINDL